MDLKGQKHQTLKDAVAALRATTGFKTIKVDIVPLSGNRQADALLAITLNGHKQRFAVAVKTIDRRLAVAQIQAQLQEFIAQRHPECRPLLIAPFVTASLAEECRKLELAFLDTAGNLYLPTDRFLADIRGKARPAQPFKDTYRANHSAGLKVIFALLCRPALVGASYRDMAKFSRVALGAIGPVLRDLTERGYLQKTKTKTLLRKKELLNEWVTYYPANLRPTLRPRRYQTDREQLMRVDLEAFEAYWGGEYGAEKLSRYLKAEHFLIYTPTASANALMMKARMRLAADGNTEILETFWHPQLVDTCTVIAPPLLVYADLMATTEGRNIEAAKGIYERFLEPIVH